MSESVTALMDAIERPLRFVEKGDEQKIHAVKNLEKHVLDVSREALSMELQDDQREIFLRLQEIFQGYEGQTPQEKRRRIQQAVGLLTKKEPARERQARAFRVEDYRIPDLAALKAMKKKLDVNVQYLKGVGPKVAEKFRKARIPTIGDLLMFSPKRYEDRRNVKAIKDLKDGESAVVTGTIHFSGISYYRGLRKRVFEITLRDGTGSLRLKWFSYVNASMETRFSKGKKLVVCGKVKTYRNQLEMIHPEIEVYSGEIDSMSFGRIVPVYREIGGLFQKTIRRIMNQAVVQYASEKLPLVPLSLAKEVDLLAPWRAITDLHYPRELPNPDKRSSAERTLAFEELFFYCLSLALRKQFLKKEIGISFDQPSLRVERFCKQLPFELTGAQKEVFKAIQKDMQSPWPMNRLLQGDVGSGKTVLAFLASVIAADHAYQTAFLAPTEILAEQHYKTLSPWAKELNIGLALLTGKHSKKEKEEILAKLSSGEILILLGTHALLESQVVFPKLGLVIVDEQHRFGVRQREALRNKAEKPDVLVMSATPIPRTLALTLYGDLDVSILNELPKGRKPIETKIFSERQREEMYQSVRDELKKGRQAFFVYPLVEESDRIPLKDATSMASELREEFRDYRIELIHGQMKADEKERIMERFSRSEVDVLVSTTVIEVGIDVPNATMMVIEHPERFGLSQLHQLRGRVGRGSEASYCFLMRPSSISQMARLRLQTFAQIVDGFLLAEEDLKVRGPGDFFGVAQSGVPIFLSAVFPRDLDLLEIARREAFGLLQKDPEFKEKENAHLRWVCEELYADRLKLVQVG